MKGGWLSLLPNRYILEDETRGLMNRKAKIALIAAMLALAGFAGWKLYDAPPAHGSKREALRLETITTGDINEQVTAQGKLEAKNYVDVGTQVSGQIQKIHANIGDDVKSGDLLVEIDPKIYESRVAADTAHLNTLAAQMTEQEANLVLAKSQRDRNAKLIKSDAVSHDEMEQSEAAFKAAEAKVAALKAEIDEAQSGLDADKTTLAYTQIKAPMTGTVVDEPMREGQTVNASQSAPTILKLADLDVMTVRAQVAEADVMRLKPGMQVYFTTMGQMERRWAATVRQILPTPEVISDVVLYNVLIDAENKDHLLMSGMSTQVFFMIGAVTNVPLIPVEALNRRKPDADNEKGMAYIVKVSAGKGRLEERTIHIGLMDRMSAEVRDGLSTGEQVVLPSAQPSSAAPKTSGGQGFRGGPRL
jgi:macrolide-specific efflux system membrane fusion protein